MVAYLLLLQGAVFVYLVSGAERERMAVPVIVVQVTLICVFWLAWGGYSIDAWRYWWRFGQSPFSLDTDRAFWIAGWLLQRLVEYPWSLRLVSVIGVLVLAFATWRYFREDDRELVVLAYMAIPLVPVFFLGFGNAVRQALAASLFLLGFALFRAGRKRQSGGVWLLTLFVHLPVLVLVVAALAGRYAGRYSIGALLLLPVAGLALHWMAAANGYSLELIVPYSENAEGSFHYLKYFLHIAIVVTSLLFVRRRDRRHAWLIDTYCYSVAFASCFLLYEVPFERLLLYAEIFLPIIAALVFRVVFPDRWRAIAGWTMLTLVGASLWTHPSIQGTLGL